MREGGAGERARGGAVNCGQRCRAHLLCAAARAQGIASAHSDPPRLDYSWFPAPDLCASQAHVKLFATVLCLAWTTLPGPLGVPSPSRSCVLPRRTLNCLQPMSCFSQPPLFRLAWTSSLPASVSVPAATPCWTRRVITGATDGPSSLASRSLPFSLACFQVN